MSEQRLIGIDLAWGKKTGTDYYSTDCERSGCAELVWDGCALSLTRLDLLHSMDEIVKWIDPGRGDWVVAVDAPLVVTNKDGQRIADNQASTHYSYPYQASAHSANLKWPGKEHRGGQLLEKLQKRCGQLVESTDHLDGHHLVFETYPHIAMVELFNLDHTIKYKNCKVAQKRKGQRNLASCIREHLCGESADPRLRPGGGLNDLLREPKRELKGQGLKGREDLLDAVVCAYTAAWLDAVSRNHEPGDEVLPLVGLGEVGKGMMITPRVQGIGPLLS